MSSNSLLGTAREAFEIYKYNKLVEKYDEHTAQKLIEGQLGQAGLTLAEWSSYLRVKKEVQTGKLSVSDAQKEAESLASKAIIL